MAAIRRPVSSLTCHAFRLTPQDAMWRGEVKIEDGRETFHQADRHAVTFQTAPPYVRLTLEMSAALWDEAADLRRADPLDPRACEYTAPLVLVVDQQLISGDWMLSRPTRRYLSKNMPMVETCWVFFPKDLPFV